MFPIPTIIVTIRLTCGSGHMCRVSQEWDRYAMRYVVVPYMRDAGCAEALARLWNALMSGR